MTAKDAEALFAQLGHIEREVWMAIGDRLLGGQQTYGRFRDDDRRDMRVEAAEEALDLAVYVAREFVRRVPKTQPGASGRATEQASVPVEVEPEVSAPILAEGTPVNGRGRGAVKKKSADVSEMIGKTLRRVTFVKAKDAPDGDDTIDFEAESGEHWRMTYVPDCCAQCSVEDIAGDLEDLLGSPISMAEESSSKEPAPEVQNEPTYREDSQTWTFYKFATTKGCVTIRWYGASNGYYSETASFFRVEP